MTAPELPPRAGRSTRIALRTTGRAAGRIGAFVGLPLALLALWWFASAGSTSFYFPPLERIVRVSDDIWTWPTIRAEILPSLGRLFVGYVIACVTGILLGLAVGHCRRLRWAAAPLLEFLRAVPPPVLAPALMLILGIDDTMRVSLIVLGCIWPVLLNTAAGVRSVDQVLDSTARSLRIGGAARLWHLVLPAAAPRISAGMYQSLGLGIVMMVVSEMFAASSGLGVSIIRFQQTFAMAEMWNGVLVLGLIGIVLSMLFRLVEARVLRWHVSTRSGSR